jgi:hypothetical protein
VPALVGSQSQDFPAEGGSFRRRSLMICLRRAGVVQRLPQVARRPGRAGAAAVTVTVALPRSRPRTGPGVSGVPVSLAV